MFKLSLLCICLCYAAHKCDAYKVLVLFPLPGKSHSILGDGVVRHLLEAGHEVTYVTSFPNARKQHPLLREIDVSGIKKSMKITDDMLSIEKIMKNEVDIRGLTTLFELFVHSCVVVLENENVTKLFKDPKEQFDVVINEWMFSELYSGLAAIFNCPYIWVSTVDPHWMVLNLIDEIPNPAYSLDASSSGVVPLTFLQRLEGIMKVVLGYSYQSFFVFSTEVKEYDRLLVPFIRKRGHKVPEYNDLRYNASLMLGNSHISIGQAIRLPQNYKAIGGYHIDSNVPPLPDNLKKILDNAKNGVIYFSMGSNLRGNSIPVELKASLLKMFGKLKHTVIWKFEEDLPSRPNNVHIMQWAPQQSILAHPNCILFITHGGLLSTTETVHFGKPVIGIPVFADQFNNVDSAVNKGYAKRVDLSYSMADHLEKAITDILADPRYTETVRALSLVYHDRPVSPGKELVHWVEHVVRTGGAPHLRSPALLVPWYQKCYLDFAVLVIVILYALKLIIKKLIRTLFTKTQRHTKKKNH